MLLELFLLLCLIGIFKFVISWLVSPQVLKLEGKHVLITGGSSGIGKAMAKEAIRRGAVVSIMARNSTKLEAAKVDLEKVAGNNFKPVCIVSVDVAGDYEEVQKAVQKAEDKQGPVNMLINCAGIGVAKTFEDLKIDEFKKLMNLNYFGSVQTTKAVISKMKEQGGGRIVFISSQAGQLGLFGYTGYAASKFALRGLAESLQMEVRPYNIYVTVAHPPDTETPGFEEEERNKPEETKLISGTSGLFKPEAVAKQILQDSVNGRFCSYIGLDGWMLANITCGMSPVHSMCDAIQQVLTVSVFRLVSFFYLCQFTGIVRKCKAKRDKEQKEKME
ncbi:3-ketodihydrosphingosine reductase-like isoform X1 [Mytilus edulis]|uniref:3-ketodihydrosphingosine reductase-like isoform X1 n=2 Tax=Mytilus edulis TaxID=6550 RepID=UPI0039F0087A